jgi:tetratricopeptide (TPR) repeat protein
MTWHRESWPYRQPRAWILAATTLLLAVGVLRHNTSPAPSPPHFIPTPAQLLDSNIAFYEATARADTTGAMALGQLAMLYMRRARETGSYDDVLHAEGAARRSLHNRSAHNTRARQMLAASLLSEHRFSDALTVTRELATADSSRPGARAALGEVEMELGDYAAARSIFASLAGDAKDLSVAPRLARWAELNGRSDESYRLLDASLTAVMQRGDVPDEQKAWFWLRTGDLQMRRGQLGDADYAYQRGLAVHGDDYRLLAAISRLEAVRHHWRQAIDYGERAVAIALDPATLGAMSDAYAALGDSARANEYGHAMEVSVMHQPGAYHRAWSLFLLDHDRRVDEVLAKAQEELRTRQDIYGWDIVAWALHRAGRDIEARRAMDRALALGTRDAMLLYHAGVIDCALGHGEQCARELSEALAINPYFHATQPALARAVLDSLRRRVEG